jgi:hypothetical protein
MTHDEVRAQLPELLLGAPDDLTAAAIRRHLRGCATCREEQDRLEEGIDALSRATHDEAPPEALRGRILRVLAEEWRDAAASAPAPAPVPEPVGHRRRWLVAVATVAAVLLTVAVGWGVAERGRADLAASDAASYRRLLSTLGGREFRVGSIEGDVDGKVILYDGDPSKGWTSWGLVLVRDPGASGKLTATLLGPDGATRVLPPLELEHGEAASWVVTHDDLDPFERLTLTDAAGHVVGTAEISEA